MPVAAVALGGRCRRLPLTLRRLRPLTLPLSLLLLLLLLLLLRRRRRRRRRLSLLLGGVLSWTPLLPGAGQPSFLVRPISGQRWRPATTRNARTHEASHDVRGPCWMGKMNLWCAPTPWFSRQHDSTGPIDGYRCHTWGAAKKSSLLVRSTICFLPVPCVGLARESPGQHYRWTAFTGSTLPFTPRTL